MSTDASYEVNTKCLCIKNYKDLFVAGKTYDGMLRYDAVEKNLKAVNIFSSINGFGGYAFVYKEEFEECFRIQEEYRDQQINKITE